jgi:hypothetical protein
MRTPVRTRLKDNVREIAGAIGQTASGMTP